MGSDTVPASPPWASPPAAGLRNALRRRLPGAPGRLGAVRARESLWEIPARLPASAPSPAPFSAAAEWWPQLRGRAEFEWPGRQPLWGRCAASARLAARLLDLRRGRTVRGTPSKGTQLWLPLRAVLSFGNSLRRDVLSQENCDSMPSGNSFQILWFSAPDPSGTPCSSQSESGA